MINYNQKYLKYKLKYQKLKQKAGSDSEDEFEWVQGYDDDGEEFWVRRPKKRPVTSNLFSASTYPSKQPSYDEIGTTFNLFTQTQSEPKSDSDIKGSTLGKGKKKSLSKNSSKGKGKGKRKSRNVRPKWSIEQHELLRSEIEDKQKQKIIERLSTFKPQPHEPDMIDKGVALFIVGQEPGHESSAYGTCYILKSRLGVEKCEFIYTEYPNVQGNSITGGNLELHVQLEEKLTDLLSQQYTHLYLFMECHGGYSGYCSHDKNNGKGAFTIDLLLEVWQKYYHSWKSAIFISDTCASNLLIDRAKLPDVDAKNIIGFGVPGNCDISKGQLRIIKAITFSAIHALTLAPKYDVKTFLDLLKTTWNVWRDSNLHSDDTFFTMQIFNSSIHEMNVNSLKIDNPGNPNISGDYTPIAFPAGNALGPNNSAFYAGWKPLIFWWLTTPFNDVSDVEDTMIQDYITDKYKKGDNVKIWYNGTNSLIQTAQNFKTTPAEVKRKIVLLEKLRDTYFTGFSNYSPTLPAFSSVAPAPEERRLLGPLKIPSTYEEFVAFYKDRRTALTIWKTRPLAPEDTQSTDTQSTDTQSYSGRRLLGPSRVPSTWEEFLSYYKSWRTAKSQWEGSIKAPADTQPKDTQPAPTRLSRYPSQSSITNVFTNTTPALNNTQPVDTQSYSGRRLLGPSRVPSTWEEFLSYYKSWRTAKSEWMSSVEAPADTQPVLG